MTDLNDLTERAKQQVDNGIRKIMDLRVELMEDGILGEDTDIHLANAVVQLLKYSVASPMEAITRMLELKAEYDPKLLAANQEQHVKFGAELAAAQAEAYLREHGPQDQ